MQNVQKRQKYIKNAKIGQSMRMIQYYFLYIVERYGKEMKNRYVDRIKVRLNDKF